MATSDVIGKLKLTGYTIDNAGGNENEVLTLNASDEAVWAVPPGAGSGEVNTNSNAGSSTDGEELVLAKSGVNTPIKRIKAGTNVSITSEANDVVINASSGNAGITIVTTSAELAAAQILGQIVFINGSVVGPAIDTLNVDVAGSGADFLRVQSIDTINNTITVMTGSNSTIDNPLVFSESLTTSTELVASSSQPPNSARQTDFRLVAIPTTPDSGNLTITFSVLSTGPNGVIVSGGTFSTSDRIYVIHQRTLPIGVWSGFDGREWDTL